MSVYRPLASIPSVEFDRQEAKALLRKIRAGDAEAVARAIARHDTFEASRCTLADA